MRIRVRGTVVVMPAPPPLGHGGPRHRSAAPLQYRPATRRLGAAAGERMRAAFTHGVLVSAAVIACLAAGAMASDQGLAGLRRVSLAVDLQHPIETLSVEDLLIRLEEGLRQTEPAVSVNEPATDRLRLTVSVRPVGATSLRGYVLALSGAYGIGTVTLEVERMVTLPGTSVAFPAIVWQAERVASGAWKTTPAEVMRLVDELIGHWQAARRQAR